jgi:hypothetical protein
MAPNLRITDGSTTKTFTSGITEYYTGFTYFPRAGEADGADVTETAEITLEGSAANIRAAVNDVERLLEDAVRRQEMLIGPKVYVEYQAVMGGDWWRSEVLAGRLQWDEEPGARRLSGTTNKVKVLVHWTRRHYWEGALTQLFLTSSDAGTATDDPVSLWNDDNETSTETNWIGIASTEVEGSLPAPLKLEVIHEEATARDWRTIYICNEYLSPTMTAFSRGSQATGGATATISSASTHATARWTWDLTEAQLANFAGRYWRLLMVHSTGTAMACYWRAQVAIKVAPLYVTLWEGDEVANRGQLITDLGAVPIPPGGYDTATSNVAVQITARSAGALGSVVMDFIQFTPVGAGQYRRIYQTGFNMVENSGLVDDGPEGTTYYYYSSEDVHLPLYRTYGEPIHVWPGRTQRLRVLYDEATAAFAAGREMSARAWYRPRRLTV